MKFTANDYSLLSGVIKRHLNLYTKQELEAGLNNFIKGSSANNKYIAFIWAIFFMIRKNDMTINDMIHERSANGTYNDNHIETALKKIFTEYGFKTNKLELNY